ncbi:MAG TPA: hypothetical protein VJT71_06820 [Pyrinomonadaceae bacterium]|nr:hypothetical protein [Pyrinomonadaceae bacterium]
MSEDQKQGSSEGDGTEVSEGVLTDYLISAADEIRKKLRLSDSDFRFLGRAHNSRGRRHYVYAILDELEQSAFALKLSHESMSEAPTDIPDDDLGRRLTQNTFSVVQREQALHIRRLTEILVDLINFSQTNLDPYYDHYLLYEELAVHLHRKYDFKRYFNCTNLNTQASIDLTMRSITHGETRLQLSRCWYLSGATPKPGGKAKLETFMNRFDKALPLATKAERLMLGFYYGRAYREPSQAIHLNVGGLPSLKSFEGLLFGRTQIWLLAVHCLDRCRRLLRIRTRKDIAAQLTRAMRSAVTTDLYDKYTQPKIVKGDFVSVFGSLCEVVSSNKSSFGYKSFKLRYLTRPPLDHKEDCYPAINVRKEIDGKDLRDGVLDLLTVDGQRPRLDARHLRRAMRETALRTWNEWVEAHRAQLAKTNKGPE